MSFVHKWVPGSEGASRTLLLLHGTGGNESDLIPLGQALDPEANILSPRGKILEHGMPRFFKRLAEGVFDQEDLKFRTAELAEWIASASAQYGVAGGLTAVGYSNGANIAASLLLSGVATFDDAVLLRAMVPFEPTSLPDLRGKRILMLNGTRDPIIPQANSKRLAELLSAAGAEVDLRWTNTGHGLEQGEIVAASEWLTTAV
ncbi:hydrolase [Bryobacterales bacterium F-183]|nr:hydrolase [Bryobacterales bacterium F-183]